MTCFREPGHPGGELHARHGAGSWGGGRRLIRTGRPHTAFLKKNKDFCLTSH